MGIKLNSFYSPDRGQIAKFDNLGDVITGVIVDVEMVDDKFNIGRSVLKLKLSSDGVIKDLYCRSAGQQEALGIAVSAAGTDTVDVGGELSMTYTGDKAISGGRSMKVYSATYATPAPIGTAELGEVF
jgi:hypothetical protein